MASVVMKSGTGIEIEGLVARPDLNGMSATVLGYVLEKDRHHVKIVGSGEEVCLKPTSLAKITPYSPGSCGNCGAAPVKPAGKLKNCAGCFAVAYCGSDRLSAIRRIGIGTKRCVRRGWRCRRGLASRR